MAELRLRISSVFGVGQQNTSVLRVKQKLKIYFQFSTQKNILKI